LKLRAAGHQFGGRNSWCVPWRSRGTDSVGGWSLRGQARRPPDIREVEAWQTRDTGWGCAAAAKPGRL